MPWCPPSPTSAAASGSAPHNAAATQPGCRRCQTRVVTGSPAPCAAQAAQMHARCCAARGTEASSAALKPVCVHQQGPGKACPDSRACSMAHWLGCLHSGHWAALMAGASGTGVAFRAMAEACCCCCGDVGVRWPAGCRIGTLRCAQTLCRLRTGGSQCTARRRAHRDVLL
jgi:hypothetical protein